MNVESHSKNCDTQLSLRSLYVCVHCIFITALLLQFNPFEGGKEREGEKQVEESEDDENERKKVRGMKMCGNK